MLRNLYHLSLFLVRASLLVDTRFYFASQLLLSLSEKLKIFVEELRVDSWGVLPQPVFYIIDFINLTTRTRPLTFISKLVRGKQINISISCLSRGWAERRTRREPQQFSAFFVIVCFLKLKSYPEIFRKQINSQKWQLTTIFGNQKNKANILFQSGQWLGNVWLFSRLKLAWTAQLEGDFFPVCL